LLLQAAGLTFEVLPEDHMVDFSRVTGVVV
jgi:hypothetical protein